MPKDLVISLGYVPSACLPVKHPAESIALPRKSVDNGLPLLSKTAMNLVYYAHSYRKPDADVVEFFSDLMRIEHLIASLDPPSDHLNSAKPERHLGSTDGMV